MGLGEVLDPFQIFQRIAVAADGVLNLDEGGGRHIVAAALHFAGKISCTQHTPRDVDGDG
ncbi:hypothetical protein SDC9_122639 [bioreactor metagenome]|uniref:Uncharacterized protein n=1 Tax=bioreactor metagenome TaxID=1076179 RepID=A0A645CFG9_9ZZZZ